MQLKTLGGSATSTLDEELVLFITVDLIETPNCYSENIIIIGHT